MKEVIYHPVPKSKHGRIVFNNNNLESHERNTIFCLASFGFDVETLIPSSIPKSKNPDLLMLGTYWEMKGPTTANERTIKTKFRKATKQSGGKAIFDLRNAQTSEVATIEQYVLKLFREIREMRRVIIIRNNSELIDFIK